jgi:hypothetical protein
MEKYVRKKTTDHPSVIAYKPLTLAVCSQQKLLNITNYELLPSRAVIGSYGLCSSFPL